ncbi:MAG: endonuclease/exonuclease/phosphatase family protein [Candidatus Omnitrophica bacterium]|nr:endonuclease/exonuclease/phosphatase family protein [Candidatus Omnitrophota bacterium]
MGRIPETTYLESLTSTKTLRLMTYNVHGCVGMDGKLSTDRIARVIARHDLDVVALQELDVGRSRSGGVDQADMIANKLKMSFHFHPSFVAEDGKYGNAVFSRFPMRVVRAASLPRLKVQRLFEPRGALWVELDANGTKINLVTSHLSLWPAERLLQAEALLGSDWMGNELCDGPTIICGDFNANPKSLVCQRMACKLRDAQTILKSHKPHKTWFGGRIDHVFVSPHIEVMTIDVPRTELDKVSSDHLPLVVELKVNAFESLT